MKHRTKVSIVICVVFLIVSSLIFAAYKYISSYNHPGVKTVSFAPAKVVKVNEDDDIVVKVYPAVGVRPHGLNENYREVSLNQIKKGWLINQYKGNCRLLFEINDSDVEDFYRHISSKHYYYAEIIPEGRLRITDPTARHYEDPSDPFTPDYYIDLADCCIASEIGRYNAPRFGWMPLAGANAIFIIVVVCINLILNAVSNRKTKRLESSSAE